MLTKNDLGQIRQIVQEVVQETVTEIVTTIVDIKLVTIKDEITEIKESIKYLPTRDEYLTEADKIYGELHAVLEAVELQSGYKDKLEDHETRIETLEMVVN